jgi:hypothetical protein
MRQSTALYVYHYRPLLARPSDHAVDKFTDVATLYNDDETAAVAT